LKPTWRAIWDWCLFVGGFVPALIFGVAVGNVLLGAPFTLDDTLRTHYDGSFFGLLRPFALLCGLVSVSMLVLHGGAVIAARCTGPVAAHGRAYAQWAALATIVLFAVGGVWTWIGVDGYIVTTVQFGDGPSNPLGKQVATETGAWLWNYSAYPWMMLAPALGFFGSALALFGLGRRSSAVAIAGSSLAVFGIISTAGLSLFPFLLPSSVDPKASLTVWDASSSHLTLFIMLVATLVFLPLILAYTVWVYRVMSGPVTSASIDKNPNAY
jgi:cytochrome d ubiquinol oxidase subunit II